MMSAGLLIFAFALTPLIPWRFGVWLAIYLGMTTAYSFWLKRKLLVDVILLAGLYTLRIIAGAAAVDVPLYHVAAGVFDVLFPEPRVRQAIFGADRH